VPAPPAGPRTPSPRLVARAASLRCRGTAVNGPLSDRALTIGFGGSMGPWESVATPGTAGPRMRGGWRLGRAARLAPRSIASSRSRWARALEAFPAGRVDRTFPERTPLQCHDRSRELQARASKRGRAYLPEQARARAMPRQEPRPEARAPTPAVTHQAMMTRSRAWRLQNLRRSFGLLAAAGMPTGCGPRSYLHAPCVALGSMPAADCPAVGRVPGRWAVPR
jgi:hypothetical protein